MISNSFTSCADNSVSLKNMVHFPFIKWRKLPFLHNVRWNSRAIYTLISYFLIPKWRVIQEKPCSFISNVWQEAWFSKQMFNEEVYQNLMNSISELNCPGAMKCLTTHWNLEKIYYRYTMH